MKDEGRRKNSEKSFTLIEVLFVVALIAVFLAVTSPYLRVFHTSWQSVDRRAEVIQNARVGMDKMVREIRQAESFSSIQSNLVTFTDVDSNVITYRLNAGNLERNNVVLTGPVDSLSFTYYEESGAIATDADDVKSVKISMVVADSEAKVSSLPLLSSAFVRSSPEEHGGGH